MASQIQASLSEKRVIAQNTTEVTFRLKTPLLFRAGQYIELKLPQLLYDDPKGDYRLFSIASSPNYKKTLSIAFRNSESGFKKSIRELPLGSLAEIEGPFGYLTLPSDPTIPLVFVAGGIGITPFLSMIRFANEKKVKNQIILLYFNRDKRDAAYLAELEKISREHRQFSMRAFYGPFNTAALSDAIKNPTDNLWYLAGPPFFVAECKYALSSIQVEHNHILTEDFIGYE